MNLLTHNAQSYPGFLGSNDDVLQGGNEVQASKVIYPIHCHQSLLFPLPPLQNLGQSILQCQGSKPVSWQM